MNEIDELKQDLDLVRTVKAIKQLIDMIPNDYLDEKENRLIAKIHSLRSKVYKKNSHAINKDQDGSIQANLLQ